MEENCSKYDCEIINVKNIKDIKNINFNNKKLNFIIENGDSVDDIDLIFKNIINFNENQYAYIGKTRYKLKQKSEDIFYLDNVYLKKNKSIKINLENSNIKNIDVVKKLPISEKKLDYMKISNISFVLFLIFFFI